MAEQSSNGRIEELKARLAADPESRVFYQLGEELRKHGHPEEAEAVLRKGLETHPAYLSAWISLGRVLQDSGRPTEAVDVLARAFEIDRQNVVVARLLGDSYRAMGEDIEAIKKYKLVAALHPADEEVHEVIREIAMRLASEEDPGATPEPGAFPSDSPPEPELAEEFSNEAIEAETAEEPFRSEWTGAGGPQQESSGEPVEEDLQPPFGDFEAPQPNGEPDPGPDVEQREMTPDSGSEMAAAAGSEPSTHHSAPAGAEDLAEEAGEASWAPEQPAPPGDVPLETPEDDVVATVTMGDLYARQGHVEQAREIYRRILERDPGNPEASGRLELLGEADDQEISPTKAKVVRLEQWLNRIRG